MNRRVFLQSLTVAPSIAALPSRSLQPDSSQIEYVCEQDDILVVRTVGERSEIVQRVRSERPASLVLSPGRDVLFAVNQIEEYEGLPTGSVESFAVAPVSGRLELIRRQRLSLASTLPRSCAVSPDGRHVVVAAYGGGTYSVLPVREGGRIDPVCQVVKEIGRGADPVTQRSSHPHSVVFHPSGRFVIATDLGSDRVVVFGFEAGRLSRIRQLQAPPGSGPAHLSVSACGSLVTVGHELKRFAMRYAFDDRSGKLERFV